MFPRLFEIGPLTVYSYGVMLAAAYLLGLQLAVRRARRHGIDGDRVLDLGIYAIIAALIGAKLLLLVVDFDYFRSHPAEIWSLARSGGVFYGGLIVSFLVAIWYIRRHRLPLWSTTDMFAPGIALGHVVGRLGCLLAGCCYGKPTTMPWGITFSDLFAATNVGTPLHVSLHPTEIYEASAELIILIALLVTERRGRPFPGRTFWFYVSLYAISRFIIEFFRGDPRGMMWGLSTSQLISVALFPLSVVMLLLLRRRGAAPETAPSSGGKPRK